MKFITAMATCSLLFVTATASSQSIAERYQHVMNKRSKQEANDTDKAKMLSALLYTDLSIEFQETPARDAIEHLKTILGINMLGRYSDDRIGFGIDPDTPITFTVENTPALTVLEMILSQCEDFDSCTWQLRDGFVEVGTKERLSVPAAREIRYYNVRDLLFEPPQFDNAPELDLDAALNQGNGGGGGGGGSGGGFGGGSGGGGGNSTGSIIGPPKQQPPRPSEEEQAEKIIDMVIELVEPEAWVQNGGDYATIRYYEGALIIRAPDYIHRQIDGYPYKTTPVTREQYFSSNRRYLTFAGNESRISHTGFETDQPTNKTEE